MSAVGQLAEQELKDEVREMADKLREARSAIANLRRVVDTNHIIMLDCMGQLARMVGGKLEEPK